MPISTQGTWRCVISAHIVSLTLFFAAWPDHPRFATAIGQWTLVTVILWSISSVLFFGLSQSLPVQRRPDPATVFSTFWGIATGVAILITIFYLFPEAGTEQAKAFLCAMTGAAVGWGIGMYLSPQDDSERTEFAKVGAAVAAVLSGYGIKTVQDFATLHPSYRSYMLVAFLGGALAIVTVYSVRAYSRRGIKITFNHPDPGNKDQVKVSRAETVTFKAAVTGVSVDTSVRWLVVPAQGFGTIDCYGLFTPEQNPITPKGQVKAESIADARLCTLVPVEIT